MRAEVTKFARSGHECDDPPSIPVPLTPLVGREAEAVSALNALAREDVRWLTLTGTGGVGKTRLAIRVAALAAAQSSTDVWFVPLDAVRSPDQVASAIAVALGIRGTRPGRLVDRIVGRLDSRDALLVLDNLEQVVLAGAHVADLLTRLPRAKILATSREPLRISAEHVQVVSCFPTPDPARCPTIEDLARSPAVQLFADRSRAVAPGFRLDGDTADAVAAICCHLDGLPLAIELAATWSRLFGPQELLRLLARRLPMLDDGPRNLPERQRTMRNAIGWSHLMLAPRDRVMFRRLSIFEGGFPLAAAAAIWAGPTVADPFPDPNVLSAVAALVDKNLLQRVDLGGGEPRFTMLETVREYAGELLAEDPDVSEIGARHAAWYLAFAEEAEARWQAPRGGSLGAFTPEHRNLRGALNWFASARDASGLLRLGAAMGSFWYHGGHAREGMEWLGRAVELGQECGAPARALAMARSWQGRLAVAAGDRDEARSMLEEALALRRREPDQEGIAHTLAHLGRLALSIGDVATATSRLEEAETLFRHQGHHAGHSMVLDTLAEVAFSLGRDDRSTAFAAAALSAARAAGNRLRIASALVSCAQVDATHGRTHALELLAEALRLSQDVGFRFGAVDAIVGIAGVAGARGEGIRAVRLLAAASAARDALDAEQSFHEAQYRQVLVTSRRWLDDVTHRRAWAEGSALSFADAVVDASTLVSQPPATTPAPPMALSARELQVLALLVAGRSNPEIAAELGISRKTVAAHVSNILAKLHVESRAAAVAVAVRTDLV